MRMLLVNVLTWKPGLARSVSFLAVCAVCASCVMFIQTKLSSFFSLVPVLVMLMLMLQMPCLLCQIAELAAEASAAQARVKQGASRIKHLKATAKTTEKEMKVGDGRRRSYRRHGLPR